MSQGNLLPRGITLDQIATGTGLSEIINKAPTSISAQSGAVTGASLVGTGNEEEYGKETEGTEDNDEGEFIPCDEPDNTLSDQDGSTISNIRGDSNTLVPSESGQEPVQQSRSHPRGPFSDASHSNPSPLQTTGLFLQGQSPSSQNRTARTYVDAYFQDINRAYPFVDKEKVLSTLAIAGTNIIPPASDDDVDALVLYLVMAIGCTTLQRTEAQEIDPCFTVNYQELMCRCTIQESVDSVRVLLLLAIHSLFDPWGFPTTCLVDLVARQATRLGLTRRHPADGAGRPLPTEEEHNHRLFWSIYALDRTIAVSTGIPPVLNSSDMDVPLPCITVDEFASPHRLDFTQTLQVARHVIQLRILEDRVLQEVHLRDLKSTALLSREDRRSITSNIRTAIENWYSNGCLLQSAEPNDAAIHIRISWLASRFYNLLLLLYYPSHFNPPSMPLLSQSELVSLAQKHIQAVSVRFHQRQLPLNYATLCRMFPVCMIFMRANVRLRPDEPIVAKSEIATCAEILESFPEKWVLAHRAAAAVRQLLSPIASTAEEITPPSIRDGTRAISKSSMSSSVRASFCDSGRAWRFAIKTSLEELEGQVLGKGSVFWHSKELWEDTAITRQPQLCAADRLTDCSDGGVMSNESVRVRSTPTWENLAMDNPSSMSLGVEDQSGPLLEDFSSSGSFFIYDLM